MLLLTYDPLAMFPRTDSPGYPEISGLGMSQLRAWPRTRAWIMTCDSGHSCGYIALGDAQNNAALGDTNARHALRAFEHFLCVVSLEPESWP
jgi:hypothetical protein